MNASSLFAASAQPESQQTTSVFGTRPAQTLVKEVVCFPPAPSSTRVLEVAQQRLAAGQSIFSTSPELAVQPTVVLRGTGG
jgi:hypothetical protein